MSAGLPSQFLAEYLQSLRDERGLLPSTLRIYRHELQRVCEILQRPDLKALRTQLQRSSPATQWRKYIIWKGFLSKCPSPWNTLLDNFSLPKVRRKQPLFLTETEVFQLETVCYKSSAVSRNRLFIALAVQLGLRLSEILGLRFSNIEAGWLRILRKGGKEQLLPLSPTLTTLLQAWKSELSAQPSDWIFPGRSGEPMTPRGAQHILKTLAALAGIQKPISPHSLRHTFATQLASRGANLAALKEILGHQRLATTERYLHVTPEHLRDTLSLLSIKPRLQ